MYPFIRIRRHETFILVIMPGVARPSFQSFRSPSAQTIMNVAISGTVFFEQHCESMSSMVYCFWQRYTTKHVITSGDPEAVYL